ncbi:MAG TPA: hypothetical protein H9850_10710 [Candidatus Anaerobiospirillum pullistercoris]|uniref:Tox-PL domain-containing protein n=1 Tax=Candidatus Anaerobiospirillum pullistercoris TaxID=2838452 RepID=A0A9D2B1Q2_9GAMM|nr:hypothetical protein [Candidatus Anaerobiospirillum pullistercoris]
MIASSEIRICYGALLAVDEKFARAFIQDYLLKDLSDKYGFLLDVDEKFARAFIEDCLRDLASKANIAYDAADGKWITVHPNGKDHEGRPVYVKKDGTVVAGLGEKNGCKLDDLSDNGGTTEAHKALRDAMAIAAHYGYSYLAAMCLGAEDFKGWLFTNDGIFAFCPRLREQGLKMLEDFRQNVRQARPIDLDQLEVFQDSKPLRNYMCCMLAQDILQSLNHRYILRAKEEQVLNSIEGTMSKLQDSVGKSMGLSLEAAISRLEGLATQRELGGNEPPVYKPKGLVGAGECTPMSFKDNEVHDVNPHYKKPDGHDSNGYDSNCQACVVACEMRCRGLDVEALPEPKSENKWFIALSGRPQDIWLNPATDAPPDPITINCLVDLEGLIQEGQRFVLFFRWGRRYGHIVNVTRQNRQLLIFDSQSGDKLSLVQFYVSYRDKINTGTLRAFRVDNCLILSAFAQHVLVKAKLPIYERKRVSLDTGIRIMNDDPIALIAGKIRNFYPWESSVTGYKFDPLYCGEYEGKLVFFLDRVPPKAFPDSPMYVGYPQFALVDPENSEKFEVVLDHDLKLFSLFQDKL